MCVCACARACVTVVIKVQLWASIAPCTNYSSLFNQLTRNEICVHSKRSGIHHRCIDLFEFNGDNSLTIVCNLKSLSFAHRIAGCIKEQPALKNDWNASWIPNLIYHRGNKRGNTNHITECWICIGGQARVNQCKPV